MSQPMDSADKVLFVDDERNILDAFRRQFYNRFPLDTAVGPERGLQMLATSGPYAVIVSDLRMPGMTGIQFLAEARHLSPRSVRIMLTGHADTAAAIGAVNQGNIFRFLNKPCVGEVLAKTIEAGLEQYHLAAAEQVLLEQTLRGSIEVLTEMLSLSNPEVFSQTERISDTIRHMAVRLRGNHDVWQFEVAAMLCLLGCITVPPEILRKIAGAEPLSETEERIHAAHPAVGHSLLARIPRLQAVAEMVRRQKEVCTDAHEDAEADDVLAGARMLHVAIEFDSLRTAGMAPSKALASMRAHGGYNQSVLNALEGYHLHTITELANLNVRELSPGMFLDQDVMALNGVLLMGHGQKVTPALIARLESFRQTQGLVEPLRVQITRPA
jgi:response regulator RpfG family c-di-GMP phosphodiesterase